MKITRLAGLLSALALLFSAFAIAACGDDEEEGGGGGGGSSGASQTAIKSNPDNNSTTLTIGSKNFAEQKILGEIYAQGFEAAGFNINKQLNLGDEQTALKALKGGDISAYPEYTGTALLSFLKVKSDDIPTDTQQAYQDLKTGMAKQKITALPTTPFTNSNEVGLTQAKAKELGVKKISDLSSKAKDLTLYGPPECRRRNDCLLGLQEIYGLEFRKFTPVAIDLRHEVLTKGQADLSIVFTTDPQIKRDKFVLLEDDKNMFPPYNATLLVRDEVAKGTAGSEMQKLVEQVQKGLTADVMQELNARAELDKKTPEQVAGEYLTESGLVK